MVMRIAVILWGCAAWAQTARDCAAPKTATDRVVCSNPKLKALDETSEKQLAETELTGSVLDPNSDFFLHQKWDLDLARCAEPDSEPCLLAPYDRHFAFLKTLRISAGLEPGPADVHAALATLRAGD